MKTDDKTAIREQLKKKSNQIRQQAKKVELGLASVEITKQGGQMYFKQPDKVIK